MKRCRSFSIHRTFITKMSEFSCAATFLSGMTGGEVEGKTERNLPRCLVTNLPFMVKKRKTRGPTTHLIRLSLHDLYTVRQRHCIWAIIVCALEPQACSNSPMFTEDQSRGACLWHSPLASCSFAPFARFPLPTVLSPGTFLFCDVYLRSRADRPRHTRKQAVVHGMLWLMCKSYTRLLKKQKQTT